MYGFIALTLLLGLILLLIVKAIKFIFSKSVLVIDPQNDFSDLKNGFRKENGSLMVPGSSNDYRRIINYIRSDPDVSSVHISLDTHTDRHIGHPGFWEVKLEETSEWEHATDKNSGLTILKIDSDNKISGFNIVSKKSIFQFRPRCYDKESYTSLCEYVIEYLNFYNQDTNGEFRPENKKQLCAWIWFNHCLEESEGHRVAVELQAELNTFAAQYFKKVFYHIKGQNNLAEMYSIFSAEHPVSDKWKELLKAYMYTGTLVDNKSGKESYEAVKSSRNLNTKLNTHLMDTLFGINSYFPKGTKTVVVCGEARTHCAKSSLSDLMAYAKEKGIEGHRIIFMVNCSSPIPGVPDDLESIVRKNGYTVDERTFGVV